MKIIEKFMGSNLYCYNFVRHCRPIIPREIFPIIAALKLPILNHCFFVQAFLEPHSVFQTTISTKIAHFNLSSLNSYSIARERRSAKSENPSKYCPRFNISVYYLNLHENGLFFVFFFSRSTAEPSITLVHIIHSLIASCSECPAVLSLNPDF